MKHTPGLCGCRVQAVRWSPGKTEAAFEVAYCPMHQAAPELLAACYALVNAVPNALQDRLAAIAKAEGKA